MAIDVPDWLRLTQLSAAGLIGTASVPVGQSRSLASYTVSPFATGVLIVPLQTTLGYSFINCVDGQSSRTFANVGAGNFSMSPVVVALVGSSLTSISIDVQMVGNNVGSSTLNVASIYQLFGTAVQWLQNFSQQPLYVTQVPDPLPSTNINNIQVVHVNAAPIASGTATLVAGLVSHRITVYGYDLTLTPSLTPAGAGLYEVFYEDTTAAVVVVDQELRVSTGVGSNIIRHALDVSKGIPLPEGAGLKYLAWSGNVAACDIKGIFYYTNLPCD